MKQRGRLSAVGLVPLDTHTLDRCERPSPPAELTSEQAEEWLSVVNRMEADWFTRETHGLLAQLCRHVCRARKISQLLDRLERKKTIDVGDYDRLAKMAERETRCIAMCMTKMRLIQQSTYDQSKKKPIVPTQPWKQAATG